MQPGKSESTKRPRQDYVSSSPVERGHGKYAARRLKIYAFDPQLGRRRKHRISIEVPYENLDQVTAEKPDGSYELISVPTGRLVSVKDYDAGSDRHYELVNLDDPMILHGGGLDPVVSDPKFHQQMVYGVTMKVVASFERALGRRLIFDHPTMVLPHAFEGHNAFFEPETNSLCFGYFKADPDNPGENLPNQWIFTCLSNDIVAHEMTHAVINHLRPHYRDATHADVYAFHEAMADIVAIFQHFAMPGVLADAIQDSRGDLSRPGPLLELARQFGHSTGNGAALRTAATKGEVDPTLYGRTFEAHDRGSVLVSAVFEAFFATYAARVEDLIRLATGGTGILGRGHLHPDLVGRLTSEASDTAQRVLDLCIRAFDYLPPIDVRFGDFLRALVTADTELNPDDPFDLRANLVDAFLARGIHPEGVLSASENSLLWEDPSELSVQVRPLEKEFFAKVSGYEAQRWGSVGSKRAQKEEWSVNEVLRQYAGEHTEALLLDPELRIEVGGFHTMFRVGGDGQLLTELGVQYIQELPGGTADLGGLTPKRGTTVVFSGDGTPRYVIRKPLATMHDGDPDPHDPRMKSMVEFTAACDLRDPHVPWAGPAYDRTSRMKRRFSFALLHQGIDAERQRSEAEASRREAGRDR